MKQLLLENVSKVWGGNKALSNISLSMDSGIIGVVGPNGAGKTTLINIISGEIRPTSGRVIYDGRDITSLPSYKRVKLGIVKTFQIVRPFKSLTVRENIMLLSRVRDGIDVDEILQITELKSFQNRLPGELPFGLLKKLEIAKALSTNPELVLLDEPFGGLGKEDIKKISELITTLRTKGRNLMIIEHKISVLLSLADKIVLLDRGEKKFEGKIDEFKENKRIGEFYFGGNI
ncbi:MAG: ATP-binding cassette domain-containing protein [Nitrososphaeria archaeon]